MPAIPGTIPLTGQLAPTDTTDAFPTHDAQWGKGNTRYAADIAARNAITTGRRDEGMLAYVASTATFYRLGAPPWLGTDADWAEVVFTPEQSVLVTLALGDTLIDSYDVTDADAALWLGVLVNEGEREVITVNTTHDGTTAYDVQTQIAAT